MRGLCENKQTYRHRCTCATTDLVGSSEERDGSLEEGQVSTDGDLSASYPATDGADHNYFFFHMPYSCIISVSVFTRLTRSLSGEMGVS